MKRRDSNYEMPRGPLKRIKDVLPPPSSLAVSEGVVKVTLALKPSSVRFFKAQAQKHRTQYQKMIREVLDRYASLHAHI